MLSTDYLMSDDFLATAKKSFDIVLLEKEHTDKHSIQSVLLHHLQHEKNILLCLEHSSLETILPLTTHSKANITIINPSSGILGFAHK
ncbi:TPA: hypothetical protein DEP21_02575 [Patescibacteria group bacterium]|nr:hypothetical protein [Candidatus Gracilibacteria bacterium]